MLTTELHNACKQRFTDDAPFSRAEITQLNKVTYVCDKFLFGCTGLTNIDLSALSNVTYIGSHFLCYCAGLANINLSALSNVTCVGSHFLGYCTGLANINLSARSNITHIGSHFLDGCTELAHIDLSALSNVTHIGSYFLGDCTGLTDVDAHTGEKLVAFNKNNTESWNVRKTLLAIRNLSPTSKATEAMRVWNIMRITAKFSAVSQVFDSLAIIEEQRMLTIRN